MTDEQIERQDSVDNAIFDLIQSVNPTDRHVDWDIDMIGRVRDQIVHALKEKLGISEFEIYP